MALMRCPDCRRPLSDTAKSCPTCGYSPARAKRKQMRPLVLIITLCLVVAVLIVIGIVLCVNAAKDKKQEKKVQLQAEELQENFGLFDRLQKLHSQENVDDEFSSSNRYQRDDNDPYYYYNAILNGRKGELEIRYTDGGSIRDAEFKYTFKDSELNNDNRYLTPEAKGKCRAWFLEVLDYYTKKYGTPKASNRYGNEYYHFHSSIGTEIVISYDEEELNSRYPNYACYVYYDFYASPILYFSNDSDE